MSLLHSKNVGAVLRCYQGKPELVQNAVALTMASITRMRSVEVDSRPFISRIEVLIPMDADYVEKDCGETAQQLREAIATADHKNVHVSEVRHGDIFVGLLNYGMAKLLRAGCDYGVIMSKEAEAYFTPEAAEDLVKAAEAGARVAGIAITELTESIMQGRIANTFAMWHLMSLMQVGGFDLRSAKPKREAPIKSRAEAWDKGKLFFAYDNAGVEEIVPLIRLTRTFGPCVATILPRGDGAKVWKAPNPKTDPEGYLRHMNKMGTKFVRQSFYAVSEQTDPEMSFLKGGIMETYRNPDYIK